MKSDGSKCNLCGNKEFMLNEAEYVAENMQVRTAGSVAEADAAEHFAGQLKSFGADVRTEEFDVAPAAAFGWIGVTAVCVLLAYVAYFFVSLVSVALIVVALIPMIVQGVLMSRAFDGAYVKRTSRNVTAVLPCTGEVRHRVFFTAHLDSAHIFRPVGDRRMKWVLSVVVLALVGTVYLFAADIARWAWLGSIGTGLAADEWLIVGLVGIVFVPFWAAALFLIDGKKASVGAGDDLSGCVVAEAVMKAFGEDGMRPEHTEVGVILTGSEECGLRGSKAWCDAHAAEYRDGKTFFVTLDTLRDAARFTVQRRDLNGLVALDGGTAALVEKAAAEEGVACAKAGVSLGATDAASFAAAGLKAVSVTAFDPMDETYHTEKDVADTLDGDLLEKCACVAVRIVKTLDGEGR